MTIHELIEQSGFSRRTIYYYTQLGLLPPPSGKGKNYQYSEVHLERLQYIKKLQMARYSLNEIKELLSRQAMEAIEGEIIEPQIDYTQAPAYDVRAEFQRRLKAVYRKSFQVRVQLANGLELLVQWPLTSEARKFLQNNLTEILTILEGKP